MIKLQAALCGLSQMIRQMWILTVIVLGLPASIIVARVVQAEDAFDPSLDDSNICSSVAQSPEVNLGEPSRFFIASVPGRDPLPNDFVVAHNVRKGDIIQIRVWTARPGSVAMHGIMESHTLQTDGFVDVRLQVKYSGRFALHFHGQDGSHFEIAAFNVAENV